MTLLSALVLGYALFVFYLAYVALWEAKRNGKLAAAPLVVRAVAWSILIIAVTLDVLFNVTVGSVLFLEAPELRRLLFTARCKKHMDAPTWRGRLARWFCEGWLNPFQAGHC
jgi:hypothetical protein